MLSWLLECLYQVCFMHVTLLTRLRWRCDQQLWITDDADLEREAEEPILSLLTPDADLICPAEGQHS